MDKLLQRISDIKNITHYELTELLSADEIDTLELFRKAKETKHKYVQDLVYLRGLIEFSNSCRKDCLYCGIRRSNSKISRYFLSDDEIMQAVKFAFYQNYGSIVLQSGEINSPDFTDRINKLIRKITKFTGPDFGITLSCGEQEELTYQKWFDSGANRYLIRIETSNEELFYNIHPKNNLHDFKRRILSLEKLKEIGYQVGTGIMVGLPGQSISHIADDILLMNDLDMDMCGIGPYIEHKSTPLFEPKDLLMPIKQRFDLTLKVIAILRIMMKDINIAASTALQSADSLGREKALNIAANVYMPNITPSNYRKDFAIYENKPCLYESAQDCKDCTVARINLINGTIAYGQAGDSLHFLRRNKYILN